MKIAKIIALLGAVAMGAVLIYAFSNASITENGRQLMALPWGIVSLVDLYVGFTLFSLWIVYREKSVLRSVIWIVLVMVLGFFTASVYTFFALQSSGGDWSRFWQGARA